MFHKELKYGGGPKEPLLRRYHNFVVACKLRGINEIDIDIMMHALQVSFLKDRSLMYFMDVVKKEVNHPQDALRVLENHFLHKRAKRVNDEIWDEL